MPLFDFKCEYCNNEFEYLVMGSKDVVKCPRCNQVDYLKRLSPQTPPNFKLTYDPKKDRVDWDGNTTRYYDQYKQMKKDGKKPRIAQLDGDG